MTLALILLLFVLLCGALWLFPAFRFLRKYEQRLAATPGKPQRTERKVGDVTIHLYTPTEKSGTTLVVVPGLHPKGIHDDRFIAFAETCAEAGFSVVAPDLPEFRNFKITNESVQILRSVMDEMLDPQKTTGMLGISYGAGPVFLIAAERKLDYVVSIGGYCNLSHAIEYSLNETHPGNVKRETHEWGRLIFALNHIDQLAQAEDLDILRNSLALRLDLKEEKAEVIERGLSPAGKKLLQGILKGLVDDQRKAFEDILQCREKEAFELSPQSVLSKIPRDTLVYLIHGTTDPAIPYEETVELQAGLKKAGVRTHCLITHGLTHVDVKKLSSMGEFLKLLHWERLLLREAN